MATNNTTNNTNNNTKPEVAPETTQQLAPEKDPHITPQRYAFRILQARPTQDLKRIVFTIDGELPYIDVEGNEKTQAQFSMNTVDIMEKLAPFSDILSTLASIVGYNGVNPQIIALALGKGKIAIERKYYEAGEPAEHAQNGFAENNHYHVEKVLAFQRNEMSQFENTMLMRLIDSAPTLKQCSLRSTNKAVATATATATITSNPADLLMNIED